VHQDLRLQLVGPGLVVRVGRLVDGRGVVAALQVEVGVEPARSEADAVVVPERGRGPVLAAHVGPELPTTGQEVERGTRTLSKRVTSDHSRPTPARVQRRRPGIDGGKRLARRGVALPLRTGGRSPANGESWSRARSPASAPSAGGAEGREPGEVLPGRLASRVHESRPAPAVRGAAPQLPVSFP
jgi:hypothetical protein